MKRNKFSLSHYRSMSANMGYLIPLCWYDVVPGDTFQHSVGLFMRVAPILAPFMHPIKVRVHHWFVPLRLIWDDFESFITGGDDGNDETEHPYVSLNASDLSTAQGTIYDYLGVPCVDYTGSSIEINALPFRAYNSIYNEFYRDQDLITEITVDTGNGSDSSTKSLKKVSWEKDYFTTARPWEQKGDEVTVGIASEADVVASGAGIPYFSATGVSSGVLLADASTGSVHLNPAPSAQSNMSWDDTAAVADLSSATGISIGDLKLALALQRYQEARGRYGSRYVEYLRHLGVRSSDARLQRPEYLGGGKHILQFSEVVQTAEGDDPVGMLRGHGIGAMKTRPVVKYFEEHGILMSLMSVVPKAVYSTGLAKKWSRVTKEDYFQKELEHIGDQAVLYKEIQAEHSTPNEIFGYQARYENYKSHFSSVHGDFGFDSTFNYWHLAREFSGDVALNSSFIECTPTTRGFVIPGADQLYVMVRNSTQARRPMSRNGKSVMVI